MGPAETTATAPGSDLVFLVDVDNTLLDNDTVIADMERYLAHNFGDTLAARYWALFTEMRDQSEYVDYLGALQRFRTEASGDGATTRRLMEASHFFLGYPFPDRLYPGALDALAHLGRLGPVVLLSDGDVVFQPHKIRRAGLWDAVEGRVLVYVHKEAMLDQVQALWPARRYVLVDDKQRLLSAVKDVLHDRVTTVFPRQGHYALDPANLARYPAADITVEGIGDLLAIDTFALPAAAPQEASA